MSLPNRGPPPPAPHYIPAPKSPSTESDEGDHIFRYTTKLVPSKNVSVEGRLEESKGLALIYLDTEVIIKTKLCHHIDRFEAGFYSAAEIYTLVVDGLASLDDTKGNETSNLSLPLEEMLLKCKKESTASLRMAIAHCSKMEYNTPALYWDTKESWALKKKRMQFTLLHGQDCTIWKGNDPLTRKRLARGRLSFGDFVSFSVRCGGGEPQFFKCAEEGILSGKISIEETEAGEKVEEEGVIV